MPTAHDPIQRRDDASLENQRRPLDPDYPDAPPSCTYAAASSPVPYEAMSRAFEANRGVPPAAPPPVRLGPEAFRFDSLAEWTAEAEGRYARALRVDGVPRADLAPVDARGRICTRDTHFMRAWLEGAFPVVVRHVDPDWRPAGR